MLSNGLVKRPARLALAIELLKPAVLRALCVKAYACNFELDSHTGGCCLISGARAPVKAVLPEQVLYFPLLRMVYA